MMRISFSKYQGAGNDFVLVEDRECVFPDDDNDLISKICDRRFGVGADGLILLRPSEANDFKMVYFNSDGREGTMCGNGGRCLVAFARDCFWIDPEKEIVFDAIDGLHYAKILTNTQVSLKMIDVDKVVEKLGGYHVETGSRHHVQFISGIESYPVDSEGLIIRNHEIYAPEGCNVNFIEDLGAGVLAIRTYERGVEAETLACGTGSVAAAIAHHYKGNVFPGYVVRALGGELKVRFNNSDGRYREVVLEGPAEFVFKGEIIA